MTGQTLSAGGIVFTDFAPLIDGAVPACVGPQITQGGRGWTLTWSVGTQRFVVEIEADPRTLRIALEGVAGGSVDSLGLRIGRAANVVRYLRNGYTSWDGSYFVEIDNARDIVAADPTAVVGYAMTALVSEAGETAVLGFLRHDRFQSRFRFAFAEGPLTIDVETLIDASARGDRIEAEPLVLLSGVDVEETLRDWARRVAQASPLPPRIREQRIAGWCSWYNLYASISEPIILEHLAAAAQFRDRYRVSFDIFQIDDGFTAEMGDWLEVKPQFPRGMKPLLADIRAKGFTPGLWIAPFMVGNRGRLYAEHPDWVVTDRASGKPIAPMTFYGEFRWHKRSEEYYVLDITHPAAEAYVRKVFRTWAHDWGCGYFKTDFMYFGSEYGPRQARWHTEGLSRIEIWMRMARLIREEIGAALWLGCGGPIWAGVGLVDAVRIGRDIGVSWEGHYSAESLLRDQASRNFGNGIFWQADPDCILLRERFHHLTDEQVRSLALFAGLAGGVLMTSDRLDEISDDRGRLFADLARESRAQPCDFPQLGRVALRHRIGTSHTGAPKLMSEGDPVLVQRLRKTDGTVLTALLNTGSTPADREIDGVQVSLPPYATRILAGKSHAFCRRPVERASATFDQTTRAPMSRISDLQQRFQAFAGRPGRVSFAPGRINLIGEHTDYSGGFVLPASLALGTWTVAALRDDRKVRVLSEGQHATEEFALDIAPGAATKRWSDYVAGVAWALQQTGCTLRGADLLIASDVPMGSGLSSSAALEVSVAYGLLAVAAASLSPLEIALACQRAENEFVGARCGIMDQFAATHGEPGRALMLDCADYSWKTAPLLATHRWVVGNTMVRHSVAHGEYNVRRAEAEELVERMRRHCPQRSRLADLSDAETNELMPGLSPILARRLRHIVSENRRVHEAYAALSSSDVARLGQLLFASHESLRQDYEVSCRELDLLVEIARGVPGVVGARMIGGGFGGCTLTLVEAQHVENLLEQLRLNYVQKTGQEPATYICEFAGAGGVLA